LSYDSRYPYRGTQQSCQTQTPTQFRVRQWYKLTPGDADMLKAGVKQQPIAVGLDASSLQNYRSGVYNGFCATSLTNHFMTVVGYGVYNGQNVWKLENSWGTSWGLSGFVFLPRRSGYTYSPCGITNFPAYLTFR
jgi:C1A family cysteine protease